MSILFLKNRLILKSKCPQKNRPFEDIWWLILGCDYGYLAQKQRLLLVLQQPLVRCHGFGGAHMAAVTRPRSHGGGYWTALTWRRLLGSAHMVVLTGL